MRFAPLALVLALGLTTAASAQPVIDGDLTDAQYVLLDDNAGGPPSSSFGNTDQLNAVHAHVDVPGNTLYLGLAGSLQFNRALVFLDTRAGGYATADYGTVADGAGGGANAFNSLRSGTAFDPGFLADFAIEVNVFDGVSYVTLIELAGDRASGDASLPQYLGASNEIPLGAVGAAYTQDPANFTTGIELALSIGETSSALLQVTASAVSVFAMVISNDGFLSNQLMSPADVDQGNFGFDDVDFGTETPNPVAYTWFRTSAVAGNRQVSAPFLDAQVRDFALQNHIQGLNPSVAGTGSIPNGAPNFQTYGGISFGPGYRSYSSDGNPLNLATGNFWYLYDTMVSDRWVPLPFTLQAGGPEYAGLVGQNDFSPPADGTASYLRANPYASPFDTAFLTETTGYTLSNSIFIWDPNVGVAGDYVEYDRSSATVADRTVPVMSGFWADLTDTSGGTLGAPTFRFDPAGRVRPSVGIARTESDRRAIAFELDLVDGADSYLVDRTTRMVFADGGAPGVDAFDAAEPPSIATQYARLSFVDGDVMRAVVGRELDPTETVTARLAMSTVALGEQTYRLRWDAETIPAGWTAELRDLETGVTTDLLVSDGIEFLSADGPSTDRFELVVTSSSVVSGETASESLAEVIAPRPNPSTGQATMRVSVDRPQAVRVEAFDLLGRRVAVVFDGTVETAQAVSVDATAFAPGLYVLRTTGETFATSHRFTVAR